MSTFSKLSVSYNLSKRALEEVYIQTGHRSFSSRSLVIDETSLTPDQRRQLIEYRAAIIDLNDFRLHAGRLATITCVPAGKNALGQIQRATIKIETLELDTDPTADSAFDLLVAMTPAIREVKQFMLDQQPVYDQLKAEADLIRQEKQRIAAEQRAIAAQLALEARRNRAIIPWREDNTAIVNLHDAIFAISGLDPDHRFKNWIRRIEKIDRDRNNGYTFQGTFQGGDWVNDRTYEIARGEPMVFLVAATTGSRRYQTTEYRIVTLDEFGVLHLTEIATDDTDAGWALRIRDNVAKLLQ